MDSTGYAADNLKTLKAMHWLMRVPETVADAKCLVQETEQAAMHSLGEGHWGIEVKLTYAKVEERWLIFFFQAAYDRDCIN